jgi:hypothetical protein
MCQINISIRSYLKAFGAGGICQTAKAPVDLQIGGGFATAWDIYQNERRCIFNGLNGMLIWLFVSNKPNTHVF